MKIENRWSPVLLLLVLSVGCGTARPLMPVPESLETSSLLSVKRNRSGFGSNPLRFGEWKMTKLVRDGFPSRTTQALGTSHATYSQSKGSAKYHFTFAPAAREQWAGLCEHRQRQNSVGIGAPGDALLLDVTFEESLQCEFQRAGDADRWKLDVHGSLAINGKGYTGTLTHGSRSVSIEPSHVLTGVGRLPGPPTGYLFAREGENVASVETIRPGFVRISDDAGDDRDAIATAVAALLTKPTGY